MDGCQDENHIFALAEDDAEDWLLPDRFTDNAVAGQKCRWQRAWLGNYHRVAYRLVAAGKGQDGQARAKRQDNGPFLAHISYFFDKISQFSAKTRVDKRYKHLRA